MTIEVYSMACDHSNAFLMIILTIVLTGALWSSQVQLATCIQ